MVRRGTTADAEQWKRQARNEKPLCIKEYRKQGVRSERLRLVAKSMGYPLTLW
jgi:hypothetical protein